MTAKELIDKLSAFDPNEVVSFLVAGDSDTYDVVTAVSYDEDLEQVVIIVE